MSSTVHLPSAHSLVRQKCCRTHLAVIRHERGATEARVSPEEQERARKALHAELLCLIAACTELLDLTEQS